MQLRQKQSPLTEEMMLAAREIGIRLEMVGGLGIWESHPVYRHQKIIDRIRATITPLPQAADGCGCVHAADVAVLFPDGSLKRPDISIFCREPEEEDEAVTLIPEAVIEIISRGYEKKDTEIGLPFYLSQGVKDVVLVNPYTGEVTHARADSERSYASPVQIVLECGCACIV